ncbi:MAG TPA: SAVMC3_10250 family protein [Pyrinomonadaceae bacterium]|jgi:hypothetical protein
MMKYYYYISDTKLDMLSQQIRRGMSKKTSEVKFDAKIISATRKNESEHDRYERLEHLCEYIHRFGDVGSVDDPGDYVFDTLDMQWGPYGRTENVNNPLIFFSGLTDHTVVGLGGSAKHLLGEAGAAVAHSASGTALFARYLVEELKLSRENSELYQALKEQTDHRTGKLKADNEEYLGLMGLACYTMEGPTERLEFLAKRLLHGKLPDEKYWTEKGMANKYALMATPIYVARADIPRGLV